MTLHRFFVDGSLDAPASDAKLALSASDCHHIANVLRLVSGDRVIIADGEGREAEATLVDVAADRVVADLEEPFVRRGIPRVVLAPAVARRERMEFTVQKATELGVSEIWPLLTSRCVVKLDDERAGQRAERWRRIAEEAAKQAQRSLVPRIREPINLTELVADSGAFDVTIVPWEERAGTGLGIGEVFDAAGATAETTVLLVIGPEGGLEDAEVETLEAAGAVIVSLGDTILRTETAAIVASALALYELGALGGRVR